MQQDAHRAAASSAQVAQRPAVHAQAAQRSAPAGHRSGGAERTGGSGRRRQSGWGEDRDHPRHDWKLRDGELSTKALTDLAVMLASMTLSHDLEIKVLKANVIDLLEVSTNEEMIALNKADTKGFAEEAKTMSKEERENLYPPYTLVVYRIAEHARSWQHRCWRHTTQIEFIYANSFESAAR